MPMKFPMEFLPVGAGIGGLLTGHVETGEVALLEGAGPDGVEEIGVARDVVGLRDVAGGVDIRDAGHHGLIDPDPLHVAECEPRLDGQFGLRTDPHRQDDHVAGNLAVVGHDARDALVARELQGLLAGDHLDPEILDPFADDLGRLRIEDGGHHLAELLQQCGLDPPPGQADAGLDADGAGADDDGPLALHVVDPLRIGHGLQGGDPLLVDPRDGRDDRLPARGEQELVKGVRLPVRRS